MIRSPLRTLENLAKTSVDGIHVVSSSPHIVLVTDTKIVAVVFGDGADFEVSSFLKRKLSRVIGEGLTVSIGEGRASRRPKIQRLFTGGSLTRFFDEVPSSNG